MQFEDLVERCLMEKRWDLPDRDNPNREEIQREIDEYSNILSNLFKTLPSGARFWGPLAITPQSTTVSAPERLTSEQARDYSLPMGNYKFIGRGAESIVYSDGRKVYKFSNKRGISRSQLGRSVSIQDPEDVIEDRFRKCREAKDVNNLPPLELADLSKFFLPYWEYKNRKERGENVQLPEGVSYNAAAKGFAFVSRHEFSSLNTICMDNGIIVQDIIPENARDLTRKEAQDVINHMKKNGIIPDLFNVRGNIKIGEKVYVMD